MEIRVSSGRRNRLSARGKAIFIGAILLFAGLGLLAAPPIYYFYKQNRIKAFSLTFADVTGLTTKCELYKKVSKRSSHLEAVVDCGNVEMELAQRGLGAKSYKERGYADIEFVADGLRRRLNVPADWLTTADRRIGASTVIYVNPADYTDFETDLEMRQIALLAAAMAAGAAMLGFAIVTLRRGAPAV